MVDPNFKIKAVKEESEYGEFIIEPLEPGYGHTLGNALRRVLLVSIPGAAVTSVQVVGVKHKFSTMPGLKENIVDLLLNIKGLSFRFSSSEESAIVKISAKGPKEITGADIEVTQGVEVVNKDHYICSLTDKKAKIDMELTVENGMGYSLAEEKKINTLGVIPTDAIFTPVRRVNYDVLATRVGRQTNLDSLILRIWTNGVVTPKDALKEASRILVAYFKQIYEPKVESQKEDDSASSSSADDILINVTIEDLDLPTRIFNSLKNNGIDSTGQLLKTPRKDLIAMRNMGGKSISMIEEKLREKGLVLPA